MKPADRTTHLILWIRRAMAVALLLGLPLAAPFVSGQDGKKTEEKKEPQKEGKAASAETKASPAKTTKKPLALAPAAVEVQFIDDSTMKLTLRDERIELNTPYGKLLIPVRDIERIEFAFRIPDDIARRIDAAIADLGKADFHRREAASAELMELGERAYPALLKAEKSSDAEVVRRVRELLEKVRTEVPAERLEFRPDDVVYTEGSKNTGRIAPATLKVQTFQFGEQALKLADVRELRSPSASAPELANALPDPGTMNTYVGQVGKIQVFQVTGGAQGGQPGGMRVLGGGPGGAIIWGGGGGAVWGTDTYTLDSTLALAAVHAGILKPGQTGVVRVKILGPQMAFQGSTRNGVTSMMYGPYNGAFQFLRGRARLDKKP
jgi:nucleotide-binding universal stress UspA family protein